LAQALAQERHAVAPMRTGAAFMGSSRAEVGGGAADEQEDEALLWEVAAQVATQRPSIGDSGECQGPAPTRAAQALLSPHISHRIIDMRPPELPNSNSVEVKQPLSEVAAGYPCCTITGSRSSSTTAIPVQMQNSWWPAQRSAGTLPTAQVPPSFASSRTVASRPAPALSSPPPTPTWAMSVVPSPGQQPRLARRPAVARKTTAPLQQPPIQSMVSPPLTANQHVTSPSPLQRLHSTPPRQPPPPFGSPSSGSSSRWTSASVAVGQPPPMVRSCSTHAAPTWNPPTTPPSRRQGQERGAPWPPCSATPCKTLANTSGTVVQAKGEEAAEEDLLEDETCFFDSSVAQEQRCEASPGSATSAITKASPAMSELSAVRDLATSMLLIRDGEEESTGCQPASSELQNGTGTHIQHSGVHRESLCDETQLVFPPPANCLAGPCGGQGLKEEITSPTKACGTTGQQKGGRVPPTSTETTRASTCTRGGVFSFGGSCTPPDDGLKLWCGLHGLSEAVLRRLQRERFQTPEHLIYLDEKDMREVVDGLAKGEKCGFFHAVSRLQEEARPRPGGAAAAVAPAGPLRRREDQCGRQR